MQVLQSRSATRKDETKKFVVNFEKKNYEKVSPYVFWGLSCILRIDFDH